MQLISISIVLSITVAKLVADKHTIVYGFNKRTTLMFTSLKVLVKTIRNLQSRDTKFDRADNFAYYHSKQQLNAEWDRLGLTRTHFTPENCNTLDDWVFDLIFSFKSCGAHYPMSTYTDFIRKHSNKNTRLIFDLRTGQDTVNSIGTDYQIVDVIVHSKKHQTVELKLNA